MRRQTEQDTMLSRLGIAAVRPLTVPTLTAAAAARAKESAPAPAPAAQGSRVDARA